MSSPAPASPPPPTNTTSPAPTVPSPPPPVTSPPPPADPPATPSPPPPADPPASSPPPPAPVDPPATSPPPPPAPVDPPATSPPPPPAENPPSPPADPPATSPPPPTGKTPPTPTSSPPPPKAKSPPSPPPPLGTPPSPVTKNSPPPPPLSPGARSPPPPSSSETPSSDSSSVSVGLVAGVVVAGVIVVAVLIILFLCCKKKRRREPTQSYYVPPPPQGPKDGPYGVSPHQWQQNTPPPAEHIVNIKPMPYPPGHSPMRNHTPPPVISSSGGSGSNYSASPNNLPPSSPGMAMGFSKSTFTYEELAMATDGFSDANLLGQGGFGYVHKGVLPNGKEVAVKQLKVGSGQGEREFQAEVEIISRVHHKHLVSLVGYCMTGSERLLVYEFVPNNTMEFHLHGKGRPTMDFPSRMRIALGSAKGLAYLHEDCHPKIIHRDIKAANILIDFKFEAMVADFGLAKLSSDLNTHVSTRVMGTFGYLAPEYAASGKLTDKSDVFSFGVMLLELITGRRPVDTNNTYMDDSLVDWARPLLTRALEDGNFNSLVDEKLQNNYNQNEMTRMVACAAACVRHSARRRPRMSQVVRALEGDVQLSDLNEGIRPGHSTVYSSHESSDYDTSKYNEDMKKFRKMALGTQEYSSTGNSGGNPTSENGLNPSGSSSEGQYTKEMKMAKINRV